MFCIFLSNHFSSYLLSNYFSSTLFGSFSPIFRPESFFQIFSCWNRYEVAALDKYCSGNGYQIFTLKILLTKIMKHELILILFLQKCIGNSTDFMWFKICSHSMKLRCFPFPTSFCKSWIGHCVFPNGVSTNRTSDKSNIST